MKFILFGTMYIAGVLGTDRSYKGHVQVCSAAYSVDRKWELLLYSNGCFAYNIKTIDTRAVSKFNECTVKGKWNWMRDTLHLRLFERSTMLKSRSELTFIDKDGNLYPTQNETDTIEGILMRLDFLKLVR